MYVCMYVCINNSYNVYNNNHGVPQLICIDYIPTIKPWFKSLSLVVQSILVADCYNN